MLFLHIHKEDKEIKQKIVSSAHRAIFTSLKLSETLNIRKVLYNPPALNARRDFNNTGNKSVAENRFFFLFLRDVRLKISSSVDLNAFRLVQKMAALKSLYIYSKVDRFCGILASKKRI